MRGTPWITHENTTIDDWERTDAYCNSFLIPKDDIIDVIEKHNITQGLPDIAVTSAQGKFLKLLVQSTGAKNVLEVGTLGGHSAIWMARGLSKEGGRIVTLEISEQYAQVAKENFEYAGVSDKIQVIVGPALDTMGKLEPPFDFIFIDADKPSNLAYFTEAKRLVRKGGVIIVDNMVQYGRTSDLNFSSIKVDGARKLLHALKDDKDVDATILSTVGEKGYDGFLYATRN